jgi:hypothetical protein
MGPVTFVKMLRRRLQNALLEIGFEPPLVKSDGAR